MEPYLLHLFLSFIAGLIVVIIVMLLVNKLKTGKLSPASVKQEFDEYQERVEEHFEQTSKKFKDMTEQYQDLYQHLSVGATSLCRPDSVAASLADGSEPLKALEQKEATSEEAAPIESEAKTADTESTETNTEQDASDASPSEEPEVVKDPATAAAEKTVVGEANPSSGVEAETKPEADTDKKTTS